MRDTKVSIDNGEHDRCISTCAGFLKSRFFRKIPRSKRKICLPSETLAGMAGRGRAGAPVRLSPRGGGGGGASSPLSNCSAEYTDSYISSVGIGFYRVKPN